MSDPDKSEETPKAEPKEDTPKCSNPDAGKTMWGDLVFEDGQKGRITTLEPTKVYKRWRNNRMLNTYMDIPANEIRKVYDIYTHLEGGKTYVIDGGYHVKFDSPVKYETPSESDLIEVGCDDKVK
jgi:hypothetical protein